MLFNNEKCQALSPDYVNKATPLDLHRFNWVDDDLIGELPVEWNHLVSEYPANAQAKIVHWTLGGPYYDDYSDVEYADEWRELYKQTIHCLNR